jgi:hypothetical protein
VKGLRAIPHEAGDLCETGQIERPELDRLAGLRTDAGQLLADRKTMNPLNTPRNPSLTPLSAFRTILAQSGK